MQSRLSEISRQRGDRKNTLFPKSPSKRDGSNRDRSGSKTNSVGGGFGSLRARAGSLLRPKQKGGLEGTNAMEGEIGSEDVQAARAP